MFFGGCMHKSLEGFISKCIPITELGKYQIQIQNEDIIVYDSIDFPMGSDKNKTIENQLYLRCDEYNECSMKWYRYGNCIVELKNIVVQDVLSIDDEYEKSLIFRLVKAPSKMFRVQLKPYFHIQYGTFFEMCEDCD